MKKGLIKFWKWMEEKNYAAEVFNGKDESQGYGIRDTF
jgi:hypothetical protein